MAEKKQPTKEKEENAEEKPKTCFVIMPISDVEGYDIGHFKRVYDHIIKPACENAGFKPIRADDINTTTHIIIDILKHIVEAEMSICDLSGRNPNVLYELGIRQAFNLPVTLIKDEKTSRIFDIQTLRDVPYDSSLRIDKIEQAIPEITGALKNTYEDKVNNANSIVQLLGIESAKITKTEVSEDTGLVLKAINDISRRLFKLEDATRFRANTTTNNLILRDVPFRNNEIYSTEFFSEIKFSLAPIKDLFSKDRIIGIINEIFATPIVINFTSDYTVRIKFIHQPVMENTINEWLTKLINKLDFNPNSYELISSNGTSKSVEIW